MNDFECRVYERYAEFEHGVNRYRDYSYKDLWKYFKLMTDSSGGKCSEFSFKKLLKALIDIYLFDKFNDFKKPVEGYFFCEICKFHIPLESFHNHIVRDHNMKYDDFVQQFGRVCIPFGGAYAKI